MKQKKINCQRCGHFLYLANKKEKVYCDKCRQIIKGGEDILKDYCVVCEKSIKRETHEKQVKHYFKFGNYCFKCCEIAGKMSQVNLNTKEYNELREVLMSLNR